MKKRHLLLLTFVLVVGCSSQHNRMTSLDKHGFSKSSTDLVKHYAELAVKECGDGNVKSVSLDGFTCFQ